MRNYPLEPEPDRDRDITPMPHVMRNLEDGQPAFPWFSFNDHFHDIWIAKIQQEYGIILV
jgi:hypothetical protein